MEHTDIISVVIDHRYPAHNKLLSDINKKSSLKRIPILDRLHLKKLCVCMSFRVIHTKDDNMTVRHDMEVVIEHFRPDGTYCGNMQQFQLTALKSDSLKTLKDIVSDYPIDHKDLSGKSATSYGTKDFVFKYLEDWIHIKEYRHNPDDMLSNER